MNRCEVVVIGAGPAGIAAAIQLKRYGVEPLLFERRTIGGLLLNANLVENYPGFPNGIKGTELVENFKHQLGTHEVEVCKKDVKKIICKNDTLHVVAGKELIPSKSVILATGTIPKKAGVEGESKLAGRRVFYEIAQLPPYNVDARFAIVGGGDAAFDYALNLAERACEIFIIYRRKTPKCLPLLAKRAEAKRNIKTYPKTILVALEERNGYLSLQCNTTNILSDYVMIAVGREPNRKLLSSKLLPGVFLAGDVKHGNYRQAGIAVGDGLLAAMQAREFLRSRGEL